MKNHVLAVCLAALTFSALAQSTTQFGDNAQKVKEQLQQAQKLSAQHCVLPPGTLGLGKFCQKEALTGSFDSLDNLTAAYSEKVASDQLARTELDKTKTENVKLAGDLTQTKTALTQTQALVAQKEAELALAKTPPPPIPSTKQTASNDLTATSSTAEQRVEPSKEWTIDVNDITLANTFNRWAKQAGWRVRWDASKHVYVDASDTFVGTFPQAIEAVLKGAGIYNSNFPLEVCFYANNPPLARITLRGQQDKECKQ